MYHLNITEAFKKYTKKHSLQKNVNQEDITLQEHITIKY